MSGKQSDEQADQANKSRGCVDHSSRSARRVEVAWNGSKAVLKPVRSMDAATQATVTRATARRTPYTLEVCKAGGLSRGGRQAQCETPFERSKAVGLSRGGRQAQCETPFERRRGTAATGPTASALTAERVAKRRSLTAKRVAKRRSDNLQKERL